MKGRYNTVLEATLNIVFPLVGIIIWIVFVIINAKRGKLFLYDDERNFYSFPWHNDEGGDEK